MSCKCHSKSSDKKSQKMQSEKYAELEAYIDKLQISKDPGRKRGFLIQILHRAQHIFGYLPEEVQQFICTKLAISRAEVYGVISFYSYFTDKPIGRFKINVCMGTACFVKGAGKVLDEFKRVLDVEEGHTTKDGKYFLGSLRCVGACSLAPVVRVNDKIYGNVTADMINDIIKDCVE